VESHNWEYTEGNWLYQSFETVVSWNKFFFLAGSNSVVFVTLVVLSPFTHISARNSVVLVSWS